MGCLAAAVAVAVGCGAAVAAQTPAQAVKIQMNGKPVAVENVSKAGLTQSANIRQAAADNAGNRYAVDAQNRLVLYQNADNSNALPFRLQSVKTDKAVETSVKELFSSTNIPHLQDFQVDNSANYAEPTMKELTRKVGTGEEDSITVKFDTSGNVQYASITYFTENDERIADAKKAELDQKAQAYIDSQLAQQKQAKPNEEVTATVAAKKYTLRGNTITGGYSIVFQSAAKGQPDAAVKWGDAQSFTVSK
ncbi:MULTISPECIES: hypothetical protein [Caproicibacterium]|uniref:Uncharacterized protein n=1 Tax=Caproicibacterium argilliputei TaxID=3030016 RepID=A0AA97H0J8_9FIRM|nr:hypothetical protein [Caproicibacterium argilliputei]WOC31498.1 hypothetical protein PXC00_09775 [Caproicibacterium argilliputei]